MDKHQETARQLRVSKVIAKTINHANLYGTGFMLVKLETLWSDSNRYNQTGYSAPTQWPEAKNYKDLKLFLDDTLQAVVREESHREWLEDERWENRDDRDDECE